MMKTAIRHALWGVLYEQALAVLALSALVATALVAASIYRDAAASVPSDSYRALDALAAADTADPDNSFFDP